MTNMRHGFSYDKHFFMGKSISAHYVAVSTAWDTIFHCVTNRIVNSVTSNLFIVSAIYAWKRENVFYQVFFANVVFVTFLSVNVFICLTQTNSSPGICFSISLLSFSVFLFLIFSQIRPTLFPSIPTYLSDTKAFFALIRKPFRSCGIFIKKFTS